MIASKNFPNMTPEDIFCRYWRGFCLIRALRWVGCLLCIAWLVPHIFYGGTLYILEEARRLLAEKRRGNFTALFFVRTFSAVC